MGILVAYDTVGIQNYIFASNKLAENVGGSKLVADIFRRVLPETIISRTKENKISWQEGGILNNSLNAEIIYEGGGNAFVAFKDNEMFQNVTKDFLVAVSEIAPGVGIAVAAIETDFGETYQSDFEKLGKRLALVKGGFNTPNIAGNQPITKQSMRTGAAVSIYKDGEYLSAEQAKKREKYAWYKGETCSGIADFSDLAFDKNTDSLIAIIHVDGNNMGSRIQTAMKDFTSYEQAVPAIRALSVKINNCYQTARARTIKAFNSSYKTYIEAKQKEFPDKQFGETPPFLELIGDGDDTTVVIGGRFALDFAARLLREIEDTPKEARPFENAMPTACAGVVLFHNHYPFSEAYKLVEELCSSAKKPSRDNEGSYIDFHLHQSGNVSALHDLRERQYKVDGKSILCRPWRVTSENAKTFPDFKWFEDNVLIFKDCEKVPHNKSKALRNAIGCGETAAKMIVNQMRDAQLPPMPKFDFVTGTNNFAPYFDVLEFYDIYENLLNKEGTNDGK